MGDLCSDDAPSGARSAAEEVRNETLQATSLQQFVTFFCRDVACYVSTAAKSGKRILTFYEN
jgi:hypothetical protein